ncbi:MAG: rhodanese-like domain-containing protein [Zetaproteobacteria bacterium]|nr:rhodanese-like domain-containing protein [Zetaproteobacteria bacterium]
MEASLIVLGLVALVALYVVWIRVVAPRLVGIKQISLEEYRRDFKKKPHVLFDVRSQSEFNSGHISRAKHMPISVVSKMEKDAFESMVHDRAIVCICASGVRARSVAMDLAKKGVQSVYAVSTGMNAWKAAGLPVRKGEARGKA